MCWAESGQYDSFGELNLEPQTIIFRRAHQLVFNYPNKERSIALDRLSRLKLMRSLLEAPCRWIIFRGLCDTMLSHSACSVCLLLDEAGYYIPRPGFFSYRLADPITH